VILNPGKRARGADIQVDGISLMALNLNDLDHFHCCTAPFVVARIPPFVALCVYCNRYLGNAMQQLKSMKSRTFALTKKKVNPFEIEGYRQFNLLDCIPSPEKTHMHPHITRTKWNFRLQITGIISSCGFKLSEFVFKIADKHCGLT